ncbi:MAG TPA: hypothetical protein PKD51_15900 [Saprospiraceae bacterium]|nr:hypothetical protein [Saprospiraceae bacterium]HMU04471.1 hypothetical protein [Saprospiraceae bacterium]
MRRLKSGDIYAINLRPYFERYAYVEYVIVENIDKTSLGRAVSLVYNYFTEDLIYNVNELVFDEVIIGPTPMFINRREINELNFLGIRSNKTAIDRLPYFKVCEFVEGFENPNFKPTLWGIVDFHISDASLPYSKLHKTINFDILDFSSSISFDFLRQITLIEFAKYSQKELILNEKEKQEFAYLMRKSEYFPPRNIKSLIELIDNPQKDTNNNFTKNDNSEKSNRKTTSIILNQKKIKNFWSWFQSFEETLYQINVNNQEKLFLQMMTKYEKIESETIFEIKETEEGKYKLIISAEGIKEHFSEVEEIVFLANEYKYFEVIAFRQPDHDFNHFAYEDSYTYDIDNFYFKIVSEDTMQFDIEIFIDDIDELAEDDIAVAFMFIDAQLGEYFVGTKIRNIEFKLLDTKDDKLELSGMHKIFN